MSVVYITAR